MTASVERTAADGRIVVIADDLTGACDSGAAFVAAGRRVRATLAECACVDHSLLEEAASGAARVWVFTTESRDVTADRARERVERAMENLRPLLEGALLFKKVDSAARGHFGVEIDAALKADGAAMALVAPAFPETGRTVKDGVLHVRDWSGQDLATELRDLFAEEDTERLAVLPAGSESELEMGISRALRQGVRVLICDAETQEDLERLATAALRAEGRLLWAGSAGLAHALAGTRAAIPVGLPVLESAGRRGRAMLFCGTPHPVTSVQVAQVVRGSVGLDRPVHRLPSAGARAEDVVAAFTERPVGALILTGGDTAAFVLRALGACCIAVAGEVVRGIPWGTIEGGMADGCVVVTKSGGFGGRDALVQAFEFCERRVYEAA